MKKIFCCPALELFHCLPLWKTVLFVSSRAFSLSTPTFLLSTPVENSEATWKKATKCNKIVDSEFVKTCDELVKRWRISLWMCPAVCLVVGTLVSNISWSLLFIYLHSYCPNGFDIKNHERASTISKDLSGRRRLLILKEIFLV